MSKQNAEQRREIGLRQTTIDDNATTLVQTLTTTEDGGTILTVVAVMFSILLKNECC